MPLRLHLLAARHGPRMPRPTASPLTSFLRSTSPPPIPSRVPSGLLRRREPLSKAVVMGDDVAAGACGTLPGFLGRNNQYTRVDAMLPQETQDGGGVQDHGRGGSYWRYVFVYSIFASLNQVLIGFDVGVMCGCIIFIQQDLCIMEVQQEVPFDFRPHNIFISGIKGIPCISH